MSEPGCVHDNHASVTREPSVNATLSPRGRWRLAWYIGARYAWSRKKNQLVSFLSAVSIGGLAVSIALLITVLSVMNGFDRELRQKILGLVPQASIHHYQALTNWPALIDAFEQHPQVVAAAPFIQLNVLASFGKKSSAVMLYGVDVAREQRVSQLADYLSDTGLARFQSQSQGLILGWSIAQKLHVSVGDNIMLVAPARPHAQDKGGASTPQVVYLPLLDIIRSHTELDEVLALTSLATAARLRDGIIHDAPIADHQALLDSLAVDGIRLKLRDLFQAPAVAYDLLASLPAGYYQSNWTRTHGNLYYAIQMSKKMVGLLMSLIVAIAAFNVISTLILVVSDKRGDIAILRTMGAGNATVMGCFLAQGCIIGLLGIGLGVALGCGAASVVESLVQAIEALTHVQFLRSDVYPLTYLPSEIRIADIMQVSITAFVIVLLATLYPAWRATRVAPAEALRYE